MSPLNESENLIFQGSSGLLFQLKKSYSLNDLNMANSKAAARDSATKGCVDDLDGTCWSDDPIYV